MLHDTISAITFTWEETDLARILKPEAKIFVPSACTSHEWSAHYSFQ